MAEFKIWVSSKQFQTHKWKGKAQFKNQHNEFEIHREFRTHPLPIQKLHVFRFEICASCLKQVVGFELSLYQKSPCILLGFKWP